MRGVRFWRLVWRFNALIIAAAGALILAVLLFALADEVNRLIRAQKASQVLPVAAERDGAAAREVETALQGFARLEDTALLYAAVVRRARVRDGMLGSSRYGGKSSVNVIDWLIYDPASGASRRLLGLPQSLLFGVETLRFQGPEDDRPRARALLLRYAVEDSNSDGLLTERDAARIGLAAPDGTGFVALDIEGSLVNAVVISPTEAVARVDAPDGPRAVHLDLVARRILATRDLGATTRGD